MGVVELYASVPAMASSSELNDREVCRREVDPDFSHPHTPCTVDVSGTEGQNLFLSTQAPGATYDARMGRTTRDLANLEAALEGCAAWSIVGGGLRIRLQVIGEVAGEHSATHIGLELRNPILVDWIRLHVDGFLGQGAPGHAGEQNRSREDCTGLE